MKNVLIVGGSGGIGEHIVKAFAMSDYDVIYTYHNNKNVDFGDINASSIKGLMLDINDEMQIASLSRRLSGKISSLSAVIYCSGIFEDSLLSDTSIESWNRVISTNLTGAFLCAKYFVPFLRRNDHGRFICLGSVMGESGIYGSCSYAASKAGLLGLVKSVALENARYNVTANVVSLGYIDVGMTRKLSEKVLESAIHKIPMRKLGRPEDVAKTIVDLCKENTDYISGQVIRVNGALYV